MKKTLLQQGDVLIRACLIPDGAKRIEMRPLAEGEVTGHAHRVRDEDAEMYALGDRLFLRVLSGDCRVLHEEHKPISIPQGDYEIGKVQEYDHFLEEARAVAD